jgi:uncharacterized protein with HEPN domain
MRDLGVVLIDILDAIEVVRDVSSNRSIDEFANNRILRLATERAIEIISEAVRHLPDEVLHRHPDIEWIKIKAIGNILRHEYHRTAPKIIWDVAQFELDSLEIALRAEQARLLEG